MKSTTTIVQSPEFVTAIKSAVKELYTIPSGSELAGTVTFCVDFSYSRGEAFEKSVPQSACPWTLLSILAQRAGFQRSALVAIAEEAMAMSDAERKEVRKSMNDSVQGIMGIIGKSTLTQCEGMQTFKEIDIAIA